MTLGLHILLSLAAAPLAAEPLLTAPLPFAHGAGDLLPEASPTLDEVAARMEADPSLRVQVGVHTDATGSAAYNLTLSQSRAEAVVEALVSRGVAAGRLFACGFGEGRPITHAHAQRRVEFVPVPLGETPTCPESPNAQTPALSDSDEASDEASDLRVRLDGDRVRLSDKITFDIDSDAIRPESLPLIDALAAFLLAHPELERVEVAAHSDDRGGVVYSRRLTQERAESVKEALMARGVPEERLEARGYEDSQPIATNSTAEGRQANRRIELWVR